MAFFHHAIEDQLIGDHQIAKIRLDIETPRERRPHAGVIRQKGHRLRDAAGQLLRGRAVVQDAADVFLRLKFLGIVLVSCFFLCYIGKENTGR